MNRKRDITLKEIATAISGELINGRGDILISSVAGLRDAKIGEISFLAHRRYLKDIEKTLASAVVIPKDMSFDRLPAIKVDNPYFAFSQLLHLFHDKPYSARGVDSSAFVGNNVELGEDISIFPYVYIGNNAVIGNNVTIYPFTFIGEGSVIGSNSIIYSNVAVREMCRIGSRVIIHCGAVIGSDGFGYVTHHGIHHKIPQIGGVVIEDDVEIGANTAIDRGTTGDTIIRKGSKIDNLIQVAHNVSIGENCLFAAQSGIAGSSTTGNYVIMAGQSGVADHINVGNNVIITGQSGATKDIKDGETVSGMPAMSHRSWLKAMAVFEDLPVLKKKIAELEKRLDEIINKQ
ncbi:MAG: UDP-3-O-(3-hydroxymyristoyl)glucosamine N-acyltransferase [Nitrospirae bacterium]|nr:UDP-3-O-(3-hydroxymyristoyl)glucosamine N-acyltransferase [Nitrospirota bacterium]